MERGLEVGCDDAGGLGQEVERDLLMHVVTQPIGDVALLLGAAHQDTLYGVARKAMAHRLIRYAHYHHGAFDAARNGAVYLQSLNFQAYFDRYFFAREVQATVQYSRVLLTEKLGFVLRFSGPPIRHLPLVGSVAWLFYCVKMPP